MNWIVTIRARILALFAGVALTFTRVRSLGLFMVRVSWDAGWYPRSPDLPPVLFPRVTFRRMSEEVPVREGHDTQPQGWRGES